MAATLNRSREFYIDKSRRTENVIIKQYFRSMNRPPEVARDMRTSCDYYVDEILDSLLHRLQGRMLPPDGTSGSWLDTNGSISEVLVSVFKSKLENSSRQVTEQTYLYA